MTGVLVLTLLLAAPAAAYRPFTTDDAGVVGLRKAQLESGFDVFGSRSRSPAGLLLFTPAFGPLAPLELGSDVPVVVDPDRGDSGLGDLRPYAKFSVLAESAAPAVSFVGFYKHDNGDAAEGRGTGWRELGGYVVLSKTWGAWLFHAMSGGTQTFGGGRSHAHFGAAADRAVPLRGRLLHLLAEIYGNQSADPVRERGPLAAYAGVQYELSPRLAVDLGGSAGFNHAAGPWRVSVGCTLRP